jgi:hypothetical protein
MRDIAFQIELQNFKNINFTTLQFPTVKSSETLHTVGWDIFTDGSKDRAAFIFGVKQSKNREDGGISLRNVDTFYQPTRRNIAEDLELTELFLLVNLSVFCLCVNL